MIKNLLCINLLPAFRLASQLPKHCIAFYIMKQDFTTVECYQRQSFSLWPQRLAGKQ